MPSINWDEAISSAGDAPQQEWELLPAADYIFKITKAEVKIASTGKTMYEYNAQVQDGPYKGRVMRERFVLSPDSPQALGIFFREMAALGLSVDYFRTRPEDEQVASNLVGRTFRGTVKHTKYNGEDRAEIKRISPAPGGASGTASATPPPPPEPEVPVGVAASAATTPPPPPGDDEF